VTVGVAAGLAIAASVPPTTRPLTIAATAIPVENLDRRIKTPEVPPLRAV
jgi:hypothetical protein